MLPGLALLAFGACSDDDASAPAPTSVPAAAQTMAVAADVIDPLEGQSMMASMGSELTVIDVRTPEEYGDGHIDGAINIDVEGGGFSAAIAALDAAKPYIVYCGSGRRSAIAAATLVAAGFTQVHDMGGLQAWLDAGLPVVAA